MFLKSIRFKITVLYMAILALTLTSFSFVLYHNVENGLRGNMDTLLKSKAGGIAQAIDTYWQASAPESAEGPGAPEAMNMSMRLKALTPLKPGRLCSKGSIPRSR